MAYFAIFLSLLRYILNTISDFICLEYYTCKYVIVKSNTNLDRMMLYWYLCSVCLFYSFLVIYNSAYMKDYLLIDLPCQVMFSNIEYIKFVFS
jgi:hypothetical protein